MTRFAIALLAAAVVLAPLSPCRGQSKRAVVKDQDLTFPPRLPGGKERLTIRSERFLRSPDSLLPGVTVAKTPPTVEFQFYPGQNYLGKPWSNWGDSLAVKGKAYSAIGDHLAIGAKVSGDHGVGSARLFEYDVESQTLKQLADTAKVINLPAGHYLPGKIHSRIDLGADGWLYYATHRGSIRATTKANHYQGDWILRTDPASGETEIVAHAPVPGHAIPTSILDPERLIFYGGTAPSFDRKDEPIQFFAYDVKNKRLLYSGAEGPARYLIFARSTGRVYFVPGKGDGPLMRFDPSEPNPKPKRVAGVELGIRAATQETDEGMIYTASLGQRSADATLWAFNTKTEKAKAIGTVSVGSQAYIASLDVDPTGRFLYYVPGAHGSGPRDGSPIVQFDIKTGRKKVLAFLEPYFTETHGFTLKGTYGVALSPDGQRLYVTWNVSRGSRAWDCCGLTVITIPESER